MRPTFWLMCSLSLLIFACGLVDAGPREKVHVAVAVDVLLQSNTPALPNDLSNDRETGNIDPRSTAPQPVPLEIYAPPWCGACKAMRVQMRQAGTEYGVPGLPIVWIEREAWFTPVAYPMIYDPQTRKYTYGVQAFPQIIQWAIRTRQ